MGDGSRTLHEALTGSHARVVDNTDRRQNLSIRALIGMMKSIDRRRAVIAEAQSQPMQKTKLHADFWPGKLS